MIKKRFPVAGAITIDSSLSSPAIFTRNGLFQELPQVRPVFLLQARLSVLKTLL